MITEPDRISAITQITDHAGEGAALLARALQNKQVLRALLDALMAQVQDAENALWALLNDTLDTAVGAQLDQLGAVLLQPRSGLLDEPYRTVLRAAVLARKSRGNPGDVCAVLRAMLDPLFDDFTYEAGGGFVLLEPQYAIPSGGVVAIGLLRIAVSAGIQLQLIDPPIADAWFTFAEWIVEQPDAVRGWGDAVDDTKGGPFVDVRV